MKKLHVAVLAVLCLVLLTLCTFAVKQAGDLTAEKLNITTPEQAEDAYFAVVKRVKGHMDSVSPDAKNYADLKNEERAFKAAARDTWLGIQTWRGGDGPSTFRTPWAEMLAQAFTIEVKVRG